MSIWKNVLDFSKFRIRVYSKLFVPARSTSKMTKNSVLIQKFNPASGKLEWELQEEDYDYTQEVARAGFADMLHDEERNLKYNLALQKAIKTFKDQGKQTRVLDIGTGTGLLAMMGAKAGADSVTACETFQPMAACATKVMKHNGHSDQIKLIPKRSTDITVGKDGDMAERANILVTEVFDTELIGEGAIGTFNHANRELLTEDSIVVPSRATIYVQLIESQLVSSWNRLQPISVGAVVVQPPASIGMCPGNGAVHDIQLAQLKSSDFRPLSDPIPIFHFNWNSKTPIPEDESSTVNIRSSASGTVHAVFMWWTLDMDQEGEIVLSCAPPWAHPEGDQLPWRDHWMQAIYYLPSDVFVEANQELNLTGYHDEYSLWFGLDPVNPDNSITKLERPFCNCWLHLAVSRTRLGQLNDPVRNEKWVQALKKRIQPETVCLVLGDCSILPIVVSKLGASKVYAVESNPHWRRVLEQMGRINQLDRVILIDNADQVDTKVDVIVGEPFFQSSILPWHNLYLGQLGTTVQHLLTDEGGVTRCTIPIRAHIYAVAIDLDHLWKIRAPVRTTQGLDLTHFDHLMEDAIGKSDEPIEPQPLWEYPNRCSSQPIRLASIDLTRSLEQQELQNQGQIEIVNECNGVALWMDWELDPDIRISGGPVVPVQLGQRIQWDRHSKQGVHFLAKSTAGPEQRPGPKILQYRLFLMADTTQFKFDFSLQ